MKLTYDAGRIGTCVVCGRSDVAYWVRPDFALPSVLLWLCPTHGGQITRAGTGPPEWLQRVADEEIKELNRLKRRRL